MFDSPLSASPYEVLGTGPAASPDELRRAFRARLRQTHPDTGGDAAQFIQVQRAWEILGTPETRAAFDNGSVAEESWRPPPARAPGGRPRTTTHGTAGARRRAAYTEAAREGAGEDADVYAAGFVRSAPWELRALLAAAIAEEQTADAIDDLGIGFTAWHSVEAGEHGMLDHVILAPSGLYGATSADLGGPVRFRRGEPIGDGVGDRTPIADLARRMRFIARAAGVRFGAAVLILPDEDLASAHVHLGVVRGIRVVAVRRSALRVLLRSGVPGARKIGGNEVFDVRTRLTQRAHTWG